MAWSPSKTRSLPSLRPAQASPLASQGKSTALQISHLRPSPKKSHGSKTKSTAELQILPEPTSTVVETVENFRLRNASKGKPDLVPSSRPRRALQRPDYRIPPLLESSPEPPSSPNLPTRSPSPTPQEIYNKVYDKAQPKFVQYPCAWHECKASLINLETLEKHIRIVHAEEASETLCCRWEICGRRYRSPEDFDKHFESAHLVALKWRLGDGHRSQGAVAKAIGV